MTPARPDRRRKWALKNQASGSTVAVPTITPSPLRPPSEIQGLDAFDHPPAAVGKRRPIGDRERPAA